MEQRRFRTDATGSIVTMALFMALFLVGSIYYLVGVGDAILYRRVMQDAADAGSHAAAVIAAKGMNLHALMNVVMMVTAGILLVLRSVERMLELILAAVSPLLLSVAFSVPAAATISAVTPVERTVESIADGVEEVVKRSHDALDVAHHAVQHGFPVLAEARGIDAMAFQTAYEPPVVAGFVVPLLGPRLPEGGFGLPVEEGGIGILCDRVADGLGKRLDNVKSKAPKRLLRFLGGLVSGALRLGKRRTCDDDVVEPPRVAISARADGSEVWLGHEEFQYRAYDFGDDPHDLHWGRAERGVRAAQGGHAEGRGATYKAHLVGRLGFAQAEYYFNGTEPREEWMWKQRWRARLRRFRISRDLAPGAITGACGTARGRGSAGNLTALCDVARDFTLNAVSAH